MTVEVGAREVHAVVAQDVVLAIQPRAAPGCHAHERKVRGAATDVGHQHELFALHAALVIQRGGDGFVLEVHLREADLARSLLQRRLGLAVALGLAVDEEHRPAQHELRDDVARARLG